MKQQQNGKDRLRRCCCFSFFEKVPYVLATTLPKPLLFLKTKGVKNTEIMCKQPLSAHFFSIIKIQNV